MCHGSIDPKLLMREAGERYRASAVVPSANSPSCDLPPELMGGLRGVWARIIAVLPKGQGAHSA